MEQPQTVEDVTSPLVIEHEEGRTLEQTPAQEDGPSELQKYKESRGYTKPAEKPSTPEPPPLPEAAAPEQKEEKKNERFIDPETGEVYDRRTRAAKRIEALLGHRGEARGRAEKAEKEVARLTALLIERGNTPAQAEKKAEAMVDKDADPRPDPSDTAKYPEGQFGAQFVEDLGRWAARQETKARFDEARTQATTVAQQAAEARAIETWQQTLPEARKRYPNFDEVIGSIPNTPENVPIVRLMMGSPVGNDVVYVLGTQPEAMEAYKRAPNHDSRMRLLYHIEAQIIHSQRSVKQPTPPKTTNAPPPTTPVHAGAGPQGPIDWTRTDDDQQFARWKAQRGQRR